MKLGIQYQSELELEKIQNTGFEQIEVPYELIEYVEWEKITGILLTGRYLTEEMLRDALKKAENFKTEYLLIDTQGLVEAKTLQNAITSCRKEILESKVEVYIENSYRICKDGSYGHNIFSETSKLVELVKQWNQLCGGERFGICINVGYGNLLGKNLRMMIEEAGGYMKLLHASDNDGVHNEHQMPLTCSKGRGTSPSTDWYHIMAALIMGGFEGYIVFDTTGLFRRMPEALQEAALRFLYQLGMEWKERFEIELQLNQPDKKLVLFGAGKMAYNYMRAWGAKYPPAFFVDNNSEIWGTERFGSIVKAPEAILEISPEERNVWICNMNYNPIGEQLRRMGIEYQCYWDHYYIIEGV